MQRLFGSHIDHEARARALQLALVRSTGRRPTDYSSVEVAMVWYQTTISFFLVLFFFLSNPHESTTNNATLLILNNSLISS